MRCLSFQDVLLTRAPTASDRSLDAKNPKRGINRRLVGRHGRLWSQWYGAFKFGFNLSGVGESTQNSSEISINID